MRLNKLRELAEKKGLSCALIAGQPNLYYYLGFEGVGYLLYCDGNFSLITSVLEMNRALTVKGVDVIVVDPANLLGNETSGGAKVVRVKTSELVEQTAKGRPVGLDTAWADKTLTSALEKKVQLVDLSDAVRDQRAVKDQDEIEAIKAAGRITASALSRALDEASPNMSEGELAGLIDYYMKKYGAEDYAFPTIVASGVNSAFPHHVPKRDHIKPPYLLIDWGAKYRGYCFDSTRTFGLTKSEEYKKYYEAVLEAQLESIDRVREGVRASELDSIARKVLSKYGLANKFHHPLGHGVGIEIHEYPTVGPTANDELKENMIITIEPGVYHFVKFGIRIEDTVIVKKDKAEVLETLPKEYTVIDFFS
ncbi:MAG: M24 family metallopeptidase [Thermoprotei archaeon]